MDPALKEQLRFAPPDREVEAVMLLQPGQPPPPLARIVARFGDVVTCRVAAADVVAVRRHPSVLSLKASRSFAVPEVFCAAAADESETTSRRGIPGVTGRGVLVGILDFGCDFVHPNFRTGDGRTRLLALWDQRGWSPQAGNRYGYGTIHSREQIDRALASPDPYSALGHHPAASDPQGRGAHGTHVMDIAAGNGRLAGSTAGVAPEAELVFVQLAARTPPRGDLGDSVGLLEAVDFVRATAGPRPWVANMSLGRTGGPHTGRSLVERALDAVLEEAPGRFIAQSCGNYFGRHLHAEGWLRPAGVARLDWLVEPADLTPNELEVWYAGGDRYEVELRCPAGASFRAALGETADIVVGGREVGRFHHRAHDPLTGDHHVNVFLYQDAPHGRWQVHLRGIDVVDGRYHAWIERDVSRSAQSSFAPEHSAATGTLGTIATGFRTAVVGALDCATGRLAPFTSHGPTRDGRRKPDLVAPGVRIAAARSTPSQGVPGTAGLVRLSGTSMAAPHVAGAAALVFEAAGRPLHIGETRALLLGTAVHDDGLDPMGAGAGLLNVEAAVAAARTLERGANMRTYGDTDADVPNDVDGTLAGSVLERLRRTGLTPDALFRELAGDSPRSLAGMDVLAAPGQRLDMPLQDGDVLLRVALGERGLGRLGTLVDGELIPAGMLPAQGTRIEALLPGRYALVTEAEGRARGDVVARRITDPAGFLPLDQMILRPWAVSSAFAEAAEATMDATAPVDWDRLVLAAKIVPSGSTKPLAVEWRAPTKRPGIGAATGATGAASGPRRVCLRFGIMAVDPLVTVDHDPAKLAEQQGAASVRLFEEWERDPERFKRDHPLAAGESYLHGGTNYDLLVDLPASGPWPFKGTLTIRDLHGGDFLAAVPLEIFSEDPDYFLIALHRRVGRRHGRARPPATAYHWVRYNVLDTAGQALAGMKAALTVDAAEAGYFAHRLAGEADSRGVVRWSRLAKPSAIAVAPDRYLVLRVEDPASPARYVPRSFFWKTKGTSAGTNRNPREIEVKLFTADEVRAVMKTKNVYLDAGHAIVYGADARRAREWYVCDRALQAARQRLEHWGVARENLYESRTAGLLLDQYYWTFDFGKATDASRLYTVSVTQVNPKAAPTERHVDDLFSVLALSTEALRARFLDLNRAALEALAGKAALEAAGKTVRLAWTADARPQLVAQVTSGATTDTRRIKARPGTALTFGAPDDREILIHLIEARLADETMDFCLRHERELNGMKTVADLKHYDQEYIKRRMIAQASLPYAFDYDGGSFYKLPPDALTGPQEGETRPAKVNGLWNDRLIGWSVSTRQRHWESLRPKFAGTDGAIVSLHLNAGGSFSARGTYSAYPPPPKDGSERSAQAKPLARVMAKHVDPIGGGRREKAGYKEADGKEFFDRKATDVFIECEFQDSVMGNFTTRTQYTFNYDVLWVWFEMNKESSVQRLGAQIAEALVESFCFPQPEMEDW